MMREFIAEHRARFRVLPICRVLSEHGWKIAPRTFYAWQKRPPSKRALWDKVIYANTWTKTNNRPTPSPTGYTNTITAAATPPSTAHPSAASTTSRIHTPKGVAPWQDRIG